MKRDQISLEDCITISQDVLFHEIDGETVLLDLKTKIYFGLNKVGTRLWHLIHQHDSLQKVFEIMVEEYEVAPEVLEKDLLQWLVLLRAKGLLDVSPSQGQKVADP